MLYTKRKAVAKLYTKSINFLQKLGNLCFLLLTLYLFCCDNDKPPVQDFNLFDLKVLTTQNEMKSTIEQQNIRIQRYSFSYLLK